MEEESCGRFKSKAIAGYYDFFAMDYTLLLEVDESIDS